VPAIVHLISGLEVGGAETALLRLVTSMQSHRHIVISLGTRGALADRLEAAGASLHALQLHHRTRAASAVFKVRRILRAAEPQAVQSWLVHANILAAVIRLGFARSFPLVWNVRQSLDALDREKWLTRKAISASSMFARVPFRIIYNSHHAAAQHEQIGYPSSRREVIPNGFDITEFLPRSAEREAMRHSWSIGEDALLIGLVGRFHPIKNHPAFLEAASQVLRLHPNAFFLLAGAGTGSEHVLPLVSDAELRQRLICLGERHDIPQITSALDIACNVSHAEAFPNTVGEAMACEVPCVVTPVGESAALVGDTGVVTSDVSAAAIAAGVMDMIGRGREARRALGARARGRIAENFSLSSVASRYEALYEAAASSRNFPPR
jgi:glycosyltransferase involved in cell wall biosynthesis